jgi:hypothetical protein
MKPASDHENNIALRVDRKFLEYPGPSLTI